MRSLLVLVLLLALLPLDATAEPIPVALRQAWQRRQDLVKTARFEWKSDCQKRSNSASEPIPVHRPAVIFMLAGRRCRYSTPLIDLANAASPTQGEYLSTFDERRSMQLVSHRTKRAGTGIIYAGQEYEDVNNINFHAVTLCFRPLDPRFHQGQDLSDYSLAPSQEVVEGVRCVVLRSRTSSFRSTVMHSLWVDPSRAYVIVRRTCEVDGRLSTQLDIDYAVDEVAGWVPSAWHTWFMFHNGSVGSQCTATVKSYSLNEPLEDENFVIDFPVGTFVDDRASGAQYLLRRNDEKRLIAPVERRRGATYEQLMATEYGKAGLRQGWMSRRLLIVAIGAFFVLCVVLVAWRRRVS